MRNVTLAATQMSCSWDVEENVAKAELMIREAAEKGANIILIQELFETPYFCIEQHVKYYDIAQPVAGHPTIEKMSILAKELGVVLPISFFERANKSYFNSLVVIDADGTVMETYRKTHIPNSIGYHEKHYFNPGDSGFKVWDTRFGKVGVGICWDQWFPETARCLALMGAEILMFPTAIGSEPQNADLNSRRHWQRVMQGHAGANLLPLVASNRIGPEKCDTLEMTFYGSSFIANQTGEIVAEADKTQQTILTATFDLDSVRKYREDWGVYRDRRPELYQAIMTLDGNM